jgi:hypothetical protein
MTDERIAAIWAQAWQIAKQPGARLHGSHATHGRWQLRYETDYSRGMLCVTGSFEVYCELVMELTAIFREARRTAEAERARRDAA